MMNQRSRAVRILWRAVSLILAMIVLVGGSLSLTKPTYAATSSDSGASTYLGCSGQTEPASDYPMYEVTVITPVCGATIHGMTTITFVAPGMKNVWASIWHQPDAQHPDPNGWDDRFQQVTPDITGNTPSTITFNADTFPHGPIVIDLDAWDTPDGDNNYTHSDRYYLELYNSGGVPWDEGIPAPPPQAKGMTVAYQDDFTGPLSISPTGDNTTYASLKPDNYPNGSQFGDAIMADPSTGSYNPFAILGNQFLRIRAIKAPPGTVDPDGWGRTYESGMLSAGHVDGTALGSVSDGYYEARMMLPAEEGTWPAFWNLSTNSIGPNPSTAAEIDTIEGYGQFPQTMCQTWHYWGATATGDGTCNFGGTPYTTDPGTYGDNDMSTWHTYGLKITPTTITWYVDNKETWQVPATEGSQFAEFFMINLELGSGWPIDLSRYNNQADMYVDWVRVFKPVGVVGTYQLVNRNSGQVLDVQGSSKAANAQLVQEPQNSASASQTWQYTVDPKDQDNGFYFLINQNSKKDAVVQENGDSDGSAVIQRPSGDSGDEWQLAPVGDGYYKIVRDGGDGTEVMDVAGGSTTAGADVVTDTWNDSPSQEWQLVPVS